MLSKVRYASLSVLIPRFGDSPLRKSVYIGSENTYLVTALGGRSLTGNNPGLILV